MGHGVIYKYPIGWSPGSVWVDMPKGARILSAGAQGPTPVIWALVDPDAPNDPRQIGMVFTGDGPGQAFDNPGEFIGTVQADTGLVYHVWEYFNAEGEADRA